MSTIPESIRKIGRPFIRKFRKIRMGLASSTRDLFAQASKLNQQLYENVNQIPQADLDSFVKIMQRFCDQRQYGEWTKAWMTHRYRLYFSIQWLQMAGSTIKSARNGPWVALDMGAESLSSDLLGHFLPEFEWKNSQGDLRNRWETENQSIDLIVCTELIEHVSDFPDGLNDGFQKSGLKALLKECHRVLRPGGKLFLTTPNGASLFHIKKIFLGQSGWYYPLHIREYTVSEMIAELQEAGFEIERSQTIHCMTTDHQEDYTKIFEFMLRENYPTSERGDDIFLIAHK